MAAKIEHIEATYRATTPMFCGGADPKDAELRLPSFKGALRFWWRALAWSRLEGNLGAIEEEEAELFGSADKGQSSVSMRLTNYEKPNSREGHSLKVGQGAKYLGYGVMETGSCARYCLAAPFDFTIHMRCRNLDSQELDTLKDSLTTLGIFGGMGSKSRKGYGSLMLQSLTIDNAENKWTAPQSRGELHHVIGSILRIRNNSNDLPQYTAVSAETRCLLISSRRAQSPMGLIDRIGSELKDSITECKDIERIAFGLPRALPETSISGVERRASPLFIHIHEFGNTPIAILLFFPTRFLPPSIQSIPKEPDLYQPIHEFLDRLKRARNGLDVVEVRP